MTRREVYGSLQVVSWSSKPTPSRPSNWKSPAKLLALQTAKEQSPNKAPTKPQEAQNGRSPKSPNSSRRGTGWPRAPKQLQPHGMAHEVQADGHLKNQRTRHF